MVPQFPPKIYGTSAMTEKGQIVIPVEARKEFGFEPGMRFVIMGAPAGESVVVIKASVMEAHAHALLSGIDPRVSPTDED